MENERLQLSKLIERKKDYLKRVDKQNVRDMIKAEINIIMNYVDAADNKYEHDSLIDNLYIESLEKSTELQKKQIEMFELICLMHGINDLNHYMDSGKNFLISELKRDQQDGVIRVPNQLKKIVYGE
jgi:predicted aldo/keto reductase-like oxidoreductase